MDIYGNITFYNDYEYYNIDQCIDYINNLCDICQSINDLNNISYLFNTCETIYCHPVRYCNNILLLEDKFNNKNTFDNLNTFKKVNIKFNNHSNNVSSKLYTPIKKRKVKNSFNKDIWELN